MTSISTTSLALTPLQNELLRRIDDGLALPAYVLRPRHLAEDVELLCALDLVASDAGRLAITSAGVDHLLRADSAERLAATPLPGVRVMHGRDHSISVERWPQDG